MSEHFINLNCANCGAKLDVYDDMERFACGYCGTELIVQRRGGTVALKAVTEAIRKVQIGTDKTAAELALVRLDRDLIRLSEELNGLRVQAEAIKARPSLDNRGCAVLFSGTAGVAGLFMAGVGSQIESSRLIFFGLATVAASLTWLILARGTSTSNHLRPIQNLILKKQVEIGAVESRIAEQRGIVDSIN